MKVPPELAAITDKVLAYNPDPPKNREPNGDIPLAVCSGVLEIGDLSFPCSVLSDGTRILTQSEFMRGMGMYYSGWVAKHGPAELPHFLAFKSLLPFIDRHLGDLQSITKKYRTERGALADGIRAEIIPRVCDVWIDANEEGNLGSRQKKVAAKALLLVRSLAHVGIIALVDEATGYQYIREERALATILERWIVEELQPWTKTFPIEFYLEICRLKGWPNVNAIRRPSVIGRYTNDFVYERLAPGVLEELQRVNPTLPAGGRRHKHHQWFTPEHGHPKLRGHLEGVMALMRVSSSWRTFRKNLDIAYPKQSLNREFPFGAE